MLPISVLCLGLLAQQAVQAQKPQQPPPPVPVTSVVHDQDNAVPPNQYLMRSDDFNGSFQATYTSTGGVATGVGNPGGWGLNLYSQSLRTVWLTLMPVDGSTPVAPSGLYWDKVEIYSRCFDPNNQEIPLLSIPAGMTANRCSFGLDFEYGRDKYKLEMGQIPLGGPATGWASVTCNGTGSNGACNSWTITAPNPTVANLFQFGHRGLVFINQYYNSFRIDATNP